MIPLIVGGLCAIGAGNFIRSWQTDENYHSAKAKNRKANRIVQEAVADFEKATKKSQSEQQKLREVKNMAYATLLEFVESFKTIDDVRFHESKFIIENMDTLKLEDISMLKDIVFEPTIVDNTTVGDAAGMLSMLLPVGIGSFGSFSSLMESKAAVAEAEGNVYEAQSIARELESMTMVADATGERAKLLSGTLSGIHKLWFKNATDEFRRLVESKKTIKYYFMNRDGQSVYSEEEFEFIAILAALSKTVKSLIDAKLFDDDERESKELSDKPQIKKLTGDIKKQTQKDHSYGLKNTYCAPLLEGKVKTDELMRPGDYIVDDFEGTKARLKSEGYDSICAFEDYLCSAKTPDSADVEKKYFDVCRSLFVDELYREFGEKIEKQERKLGNGYGYKTLVALRDTLEEMYDNCPEKDKVLCYLDEKIDHATGKNGKPRLGRGGFAGLKKIVHICMFELHGRKKEVFVEIGQALSKKAVDSGYRNTMFKKLPTITYYEEKMKKATPMDCIFATFLCAAMVYVLIHFEQFNIVNGGLVASLYLLFIISNRKDNLVIKTIQTLLCVFVSGLSAYLFYDYADMLMNIDNFTLINGGVMAGSLLLILSTRERTRFRYLFTSRVIWLITITSYILFASMIINIKYELIIFTGCEAILVLISLLGIGNKDNLKFNKAYIKNDKSLLGIYLMLAFAGGIAIVKVSEFMPYVKVWQVLLAIVTVIVAFIVAVLMWGSMSNIINAIILMLAASICYICGMLVYGLLHCILPLGNIVSLVISEVVYLIMILFGKFMFVETSVPSDIELEKQSTMKFPVVVDKKIINSISELKEFAEKNTKAQMLLGDAYWNGKGVPQSYKEAFEYYQKAANNNDSQAMLNLGHMYRKGIACEVDLLKCESLYLNAEALGDDEANGLLAEIYIYGMGPVKQDLRKGLIYARKAVDSPKGDPEILKWFGGEDAFNVIYEEIMGNGISDEDYRLYSNAIREDQSLEYRKYEPVGLYN